MAQIAGTDLIRTLGLSKATTFEDFFHHLGPTDYSTYQPFVDRIMAGEANIMFPGKPLYFAMTSGTASPKRKIIPLNTAMYNLVKGGQYRVFKSLALRNEAFNLFDNRLTYGAQSVAASHAGIPMGYLSGFVSSKPSFLVKGTTFPSAAVLRHSDWQSKMDAVFEEVKDRQIICMSGIPNYLLNMCREMEKRFGRPLGEVWPGFQSIIFSGTSIDNFRNAFETLFRRPLFFYGFYLATESFLGYETPFPDFPNEYVFNLDQVLLSFRDAESDRGQMLDVTQLQAGRNYLIHSSTPNGFTHYRIGDIIHVTRVAPCVHFKINGREGEALNASSEKVSMLDIQRTLERFTKATGLTIEHFFLYPKTKHNARLCYQWIFFAKDLDPDQLPLERLKAYGELIDRLLSEEAIGYKGARARSGVVQQAEVQFEPYSRIEAHFLANNMRGQLKIKTVFSTEEAFLREYERICGSRAA